MNHPDSETLRTKNLKHRVFSKSVLHFAMFAHTTERGVVEKNFNECGITDRRGEYAETVCGKQVLNIFWHFVGFCNPFLLILKQTYEIYEH